MTLPAALWRIGIIVGIPWGYDLAWIERSELDTLDGTVYLLGLSVVSELVALTGTPFDPQLQPGVATTVQLVAYAPMVIWGPLLLTLSLQ